MVGDFFMSIQNQVSKNEKKNPLDFYILWIGYHHLNLPFNAKTMMYALKGLGYQKNYLAMTLSKLSRKRFLFTDNCGIFLMTETTFEHIEIVNPALAKDIKSKLMYDKLLNCQKSTS